MTPREQELYGDFIQGTAKDGQIWLCLPVLTLDYYLSLPRWWRWTIYMNLVGSMTAATEFLGAR